MSIFGVKRASDEYFCTRTLVMTVSLVSGYGTVRTRIIGHEAKTLELPLLVRSGSFFFYFVLSSS